MAGVEVPKEVRVELRELDREGGASYHGLMDGGLKKLYPVIRKHEQERLLSEKAVQAAVDAWPTRWKEASEELQREQALQVLRAARDAVEDDDA